MITLGIHDGHNAAVALVQDGEVRMALQEERLRRIKNYAGFPFLAIERVLRECGVEPHDVDRVALNGTTMPDRMSRSERMAQYRRVGSRTGGGKQSWPPRPRELARTILPDSAVALARRLRGNAESPNDPRIDDVIEAGFDPATVELIDHHLAHARAAYHGLGRYDRPVLVLTCDGEGDGLCATVNVGENGSLRRVATVPASESIGNMYAVVTFMLGMVPLEHEYKLMGMAPYADADRAEPLIHKLASLFEPSPQLGWRRRNGCPPTYYSYEFFRELFERDRFDLVCAGLQGFVERFLVEWVRRAIEATGVSDLALSGGVFMNVKLNKAIMEMEEVDSLFVFPSCGDETNAIGAAWDLAVARGVEPESIPPLGPIYFGPEYAADEIERALQDFEFGTAVRVRRIADPEDEAARLLASGEVVARFAGREEFGARALGNRSILADPSDRRVVRIINQMIKCRDFWMPFATSMTDRQAAHCLVNPKAIRAPYMILTFDTTGRVDDFIAGVHPYDLTVRPQVVEREVNPAYYRLIERFEQLSGKRGGVLNTSFNLHGYPLVSSPSDALDVFARSGLRHLVIDRYHVSKPTSAGER